MIIKIIVARFTRCTGCDQQWAWGPDDRNGHVHGGCGGILVEVAYHRPFYYDVGWP